MLFQNKMHNLLEPFFLYFRLLIKPGNSCTVVYKTVIKPLQKQKSNTYSSVISHSTS